MAPDTQLCHVHTSATARQHMKTSQSGGSEPVSYCPTQHSAATHINSTCKCGRRGGVAARGAGSHSTLPSKRGVKVPAHQSFLLSDDEDSDWDMYPPSPPLSPKTIILEPETRCSQRTATRRQDASVKQQPGWKPSLKEELLRRTSIDSSMSQIEPRTSIQTGRHRSKTTGLDSTTEESTEMRQPQRRRGSTLLHPSSPIIGPASVHTYTAPTDIQPLSRCPSFEKLPIIPLRKGSSLLHPSPPPPVNDMDTGTSMRISQLRTVMSFPPRKQWE
jgi:hypothetical protein